MPDLEYLATSANGKDVFYEPHHSHAASHFADVPPLKALAAKVIARKPLIGDSMIFDTDMVRVVGNTDEVENEPGDEIIFAKRMNHGDIFTSFNKSKGPRPSSLVTVAIVRANDKNYELTSAWIGSAHSPSFPGEPDETPENKPYWLAHSLAWGSQEIQPGTETNACPW